MKGIKVTRNYVNKFVIAAVMLTGLTLCGLTATAPSVSALACGTKAKPGADFDKPACKVNMGVNATGANDDSTKTCGPNKDAECTLGDRVKQVINVLLFIIGVISVIMIIIGGLRYTISNGDSSQITSAKNTVLYAVIGLVVALLAYAIVNFVVVQFT